MCIHSPTICEWLWDIFMESVTSPTCLFSSLAALGTEPRALYMLEKCYHCATCPTALFIFFTSIFAQVAAKLDEAQLFSIFLYGSCFPSSLRIHFIQCFFIGHFLPKNRGGSPRLPKCQEYKETSCGTTVSRRVFVGFTQSPRRE